MAAFCQASDGRRVYKRRKSENELEAGLHNWSKCLVKGVLRRIKRTIETDIRLTYEQLAMFYHIKKELSDLLREWE